jgi:hypothetical protein
MKTIKIRRVTGRFLWDPYARMGATFNTSKRLGAVGSSLGSYQRNPKVARSKLADATFFLP